MNVKAHARRRWGNGTGVEGRLQGDPVPEDDEVEEVPPGDDTLSSEKLPQNSTAAAETLASIMFLRECTHSVSSVSDNPLSQRKMSR